MRLECGHDVPIVPGQDVYNYYDLWFGPVVEAPDSSGWFGVERPTGGVALLNRERTTCVPCGEAHQRRMNR